MEGQVQRRLDGIFRLVRDPVVRKRARHLWLFSVLIAICFGLITSAGLPSLTKGETGSASADRLWSSGAELNSTTAGMEVTSTSGTVSISSTTKRSGGYAYRSNPTSSTGSFAKTFASSAQSAKFWFRSYLYISTTPSAQTTVFTTSTTTNYKISVQLNTDRTLQLYNSEDSANIGSASSALSTATWYRIELYVNTTTLSTTATELRLDGVSIASSTTQNLAAGIDRLTWGSLASGTTDLFFDDIAINNSTGRAVDNWPGEGRIVHMHIDSTGDNTAWTGDNTDVDEVTPNDATDAIASQTNGQLEDDNLESATNAGIGANDSIKLVQVGARYKRCPGGAIGSNFFIGRAAAATPSCPLGGNGTANAHKLRIKAAASGTVEESASIADEPQSYVTNDSGVGNYNLSLYDLPGSSTAPWTVSDLNTSQIGVNLVTADPSTQVTAIWLLVEYVDRSGGRLISSGLELNSTTTGMEFTASTGSPSINSTTKHAGSYALETANGGSQEYVRYYFESANTNSDYYVRAFLRIATAVDASDATVLSILNTSDTTEASIKITSTNTLKLYDEDGQIGSASSALSTNTWYRIELRINTTPASGSHVVDGRIDGTSFASASNRSIGTGVARIGVGLNATQSIESNANTAGDLLWDDIAVNKAIGTYQNSWPGDGNIIHFQPNAAGDNTQMTQNGTCTGGNYGCVNEVTPNDATNYSSESTSGDIDDYNIADSSLAGTDIVNLVSVGVRFRSNSATQEDFRVRLKDASNGIAIESNNISPASTTWTTNATADPKIYPLTAYTRPELSSAWTDTQLDAAQIGARDVLSGTGQLDMSAIWLLVDYTVPANITVSGTVYSDEGSTVYNCSSDNLTIGLNVNGGTTQTTTCTAAGGTFSFSVSPPTAGQPLAIWIDSVETPKATTVTRVASSIANITGLDLYQNRLIVRHEDSGPITNTNLATADNTDAGIRYSVSTGNLTVESGISLYVWGSKTFTPGGTVTTNVTGGDVKINTSGTLSMGGNALSVGGSWNNAGTFTHGNNTTTFTSTATGKTLAGTMTGSSAFYDLVFNGSGGAWSFSAAATTDRDFTITTGTVTAPSGNLTIARNFTNDATFTHNSGTVVLSTSTTATVSGAASATTFNNFSSTVAGKTIQFKKHTTGTPVFTFAGTFTITGASGNLINLYSDTSGTQWKAHFNANQYSVTYVNLRDGGCDTGTSNVYMDTGSMSVSNNDTCWIFPINRLWSGGAELQSSTAEVETNFNDGASQSISTATKRSGAASWRVNTTSTTSAFNKYFLNTGGTQGKYWARAYVYVATTPAVEIGLLNFNGSAERLGVRMNSDRTIELWNEEDNLQIGSASATALSTNTWYRIELYGDTTTLASSNAELRLNGTSIASGTANLAGAFDRIQWGVLNANATADIYFDDIAVNGNSGAPSNWPGDGKIVHLHPNADGDNVAWADSSANGTDYDDVDETTPNDGTDYISSSTAGNLEDVNLESSSTAGIGSGDTITLVSPGVRFRGCNSGGACIGGGAGDDYRTRVKAAGGGTVEESATITADTNLSYLTNYQQNTVANIYSLTLYDMPGNSTAKWTPTDLDSAQVGMNNVRFESGFRTTSMWLLVEYVPAVVVSGTIYSDEGSTVYNCSTDNLTIRLSLNGGANQTTTCTAAGGTYSITLAANPAAASDPLIVFIDTVETPKATTATLVADTSSSITGFDLYQNRVIIRHEDAGPITNTKLSTGDNGDAGIRYNVASGNITTDSGMKLLVWTGKTYTPGGTVTTTVGSSPSGDLGIQSTATLSMGGNALSVGGSYSNSGTFTSGSNTTTFTATSTGQTIAGTLNGSSSFYNLIFNGSGGGWSNSAAMAVTNDLTLTAGTLSGTNDVTVNGNVAGTAGATNFTGGTFEQRVAANKNFGTTSGSTAWTFSSLTFSNSHASTGFTITTQAGTGGITVSSILRIGKSGDASGATTTLDAGGRTWTLNGTGGDPFQILSSAPIGVLTANTSTFAYNGENASGNTTVQSATYYTVTIGKSSICTNDTYVLEAATTATNSLTINSCGTLDVVNGSNFALTLGGNYTNSGTFTARAGTVTFNATTTGKTLNGTMTGGSAFYNVTFDGVGGGWTFNAAVAATNDFIVNNGAVTASNNNLTVTRDFTLANTAGVGYTAGSSTISISRHFNDTGDKLTENTSTLTMAGTGTLTAATNEHFYTLSMAPSGGVTTLSANAMVIDNQLNFNGGTGTGSGSYLDVRCSANCTPVVFNSASTLNGTQDIYFRANAGAITITIAGANFGSWGVIPYAAVGNSSTWQLGGNFTTTSLNGPRLEAETGITGSIFTTTASNYSLSSGSLIFAPCTPSRTGSWTVNLNASTVTLSTTGDSLTVGSNCGSHTLNMNTSSVTASGNVKFVNGTGTIAVNAGTSTLTFTPPTSSVKTYSPNGQSLYNVIINGASSSADIQPDAAVAITNDLTMTNGRLVGTQNITVNGNVAGTAGAFNLTGGTFEQRVTANKNFGTTSGSTAWTFSDLTFSNSHASTGFTITTQTGGTGGITVSGVMRIGKSGDAAGATTTFNGGNRTWTLSGTGGDPFQILASPAGVLTPATSTFTYTGNNAGGNTNVERNPSGTGYYNLDANNTSETFVLEGNTSVGNDLTVTNGVLSTTGSNFSLTVTRDVTLSNTAGVGLTGNGSTISVGRHWTDAGSKFSAGTSTVDMVGTGTLSPASTFEFYNLNLAHATGTGCPCTTTIASSITVRVSNIATLYGGTLTGTSDFLELRPRSSSTPLVFNSATTLNGSGNTVTWTGFNASLTVTIAGANYGNWNIWPSASTATTTFNLGGTTTTTAQVRFYATAATGVFNTQNNALTADNIQLGSSGATTTTSTNFGSSSVTLTSTTTSINPFTSGSYNLDLGSSSVDVKGNVNFVNSTGTISVTPGTSTVTWTHSSGTKTYAPNSQSLYNITLNCSGGTVQPTGAVIATNNFTITAGTYDTVSGSNYALTIGNNYSNSGTFTAQQGTVTFNATDAGNTLGGTMTGSSAFYNLTFNGSGGDWTPSASVAVTNDLSMSAGSLLGTQNVTVNGNATGPGTITLTGGLFEQRVASGKNFGTTSGANAWSFVSLTFSNSSGAGATITTQTGGSGGITVSVLLKVGTTGDTGATTLDAGNRTWTLSGNATTGDPFQLLASPAGVLTANTSTFTYTGNYALGNMTVQVATYYNLDINNASETFVLEGNTSASNDVTVTTGTLSTTGTNYSLTITRDMTINGTFTANGSTVTISRNWTFNTGATFNRGTSLVVMNGDGSILGSALTQFQDLSVAYSTKTTTFNGGTSRTDSFGTFTVNGGTMTSGSSNYEVQLIRSGAGTYTPMVFASATTMTGTTPKIVYRATVASVIFNVAGGNYGSWYVNPYASAGGTDTWNLAGGITTTGDFYMYGATGLTGLTVNTQNNSVTAARLVLGGSSANSANIALNLGSSTVTLSNGTSDAFYPANTTPNSSTHTVDFGTSSVNVTGNVKFVNGSGSITTVEGTSTVTMTPGASATTSYTPNGQSLYHFIVNGGNSSSKVNLAGNADFNGNLTVSQGQLDTVSGSNYAIDTFDVTMSGTGTIVANASTLTVRGNWTSNATWQSNFGTSTVSFNGTSKTITTNSGSSNHFNKVTVAGGANYTAATGSAVNIGSDLNIQGTLNVSSACDGNNQIDYKGGTGTTLTIAGTLGGTGCFYVKSSSTPTYSYSGTISVSSFYYALSVSTTVPAYSYGGNLYFETSAVTATFTIGSGTMSVNNSFNTNSNITGTLTIDNSVNNTNFTVGDKFRTLSTAGSIVINMGSATYDVKGNWDDSDSATFNNGTSTVLLSGGSTQTVSRASGANTFYNLTITNASGASASDCERTGFTASVAFSNNVTVSNNLTFTTANTRVQYNNGSTYTFTNINWNGQATGTKLYFRNSVAGSGSWNLNVSGTQTAVSYINVSRSDASTGNTIGASNGTNTDCGNNINWSFANPNSPTNLAQKKTTDVVISTGGWTNETSVKFTADISDGDNPATIQLCVEKDLIATSFSNTEDSCGSTVSYTGTAVAASVTVGSLTDTAEYHWQVRVKDSGGAYSAWVSYGGNAESARDVGIDTTACSPLGLVYDGTSTGVDSAYNDGSLTSLSANWGAFNCGVSGLNFYEYSIGTTSGGTQIKGWTNNSTTLSVTSTSLVLHTNQRYYFNVRATDNAGNLSGVSSSNGQDVLPQITFSLSGNTITFSNLNDSNNRQDTKTTTLTTSTNAYGGYVVTQYAGGLLTSGSSTIPMFSAGTYASPAAWGTGFCSGTTCGFGYTSNDTTIQGSNKFSSGTLYAPYSQTAAGDIVADHTTAIDGTSGAVSNEQFTITHKVAVDALQPAKSYTGTIYYVVTGTF